MTDKTFRIDLAKLVYYILKRVWLVILCGVIGFSWIYWKNVRNQQDTYTAYGTMYVYNGNPNLINYQYTNTADLNSAVQLLDTYMVVVKSNKVLEAVVDRLIPNYPYITAGYISGTLRMGSVSETGVLMVSCTTDEAKKSADICNAVLDVAPAEIIRVVSAGNIEIIDYATAPAAPDRRSPIRACLIGALIGILAACALLTLTFLLFQRIVTPRELSDQYTVPVLALIHRTKKKNKDPSVFLLSVDTPMDIQESYSKLRMNLMYTMVDAKNHAVMINSAVPGEGKSTISANLAVSFALGGLKVILIDADMRRSCQSSIFGYDRHAPGLSEVLVGEKEWKSVIIDGPQSGMSILPAGRQPVNPAQLLGSSRMRTLLEELEQTYDFILIDAAPVNIVSDPLAMSDMVAGCIFVIRQNFSDHKELRKALNAAEMTSLNVLGFVFYGEKLHKRQYYRKYYHNYYNNFDRNNRNAALKPAEDHKEEAEDDAKKDKANSSGAHGSAGSYLRKPSRRG